MTIELKDIIAKCNGLEIYENRSLSDEYCELVFLSKDNEKWNKVFVDILGPAIKPTDAKPAKDDLQLTKDYGGIQDDQTLFKKKYADKTLIAMLWPWQSGTYTTLKLILLNKKN